MSNKKPLKTPFVEGNQFWKARSSHGRNPIFKTPEQLWNACEEYFEWVTNNPLKEEKVFHCNGKITRAELSKMRAMTISGLCIFLDIADQTWKNYKGKPDFLDICERVENVIYNQKLQGAAAELLNPNIIARDLGLRDRIDSEHSVDLSALTEEELDAKIREKMAVIESLKK